jgi:hypothetical protein
MHVVVTGSHGLIGTALAAALRARGDTVTALVRSGSPRSERDIAWNPASGAIDLMALQARGPVGGIVNLAGAGIADRRWTASRKAEIIASRVASTDLVVRVIDQLDQTPRVLVNASAIGIYGDRGAEVLTEKSAPGSGFLADTCRQWERSAAAAPCRTVLLRTGIVLSRKGGTLGRLLPLVRAGVAGQFASGTQYMSWITLDDEVSCILALLDGAAAGLEGPVNATAPEPVTNAEFVKALGRAAHRPTFLRVPGPALKLVLGGELTGEAILSSLRVVPAALLDGTGFTFEHPTLDAAIASLLG